MLDASIGTEILDGLLGMLGSKDSPKRLVFNGDLYLGLLTKLPDQDGFSEPADPGYMRIKITTESRINKTKFISHAEVGEPIDGAISVCVTNQSLIMFPESSVAWEPIVGFGLFKSNDVSDNTRPILWGSVTADDGATEILIHQHEVPIIRTGGFKVSLA